MSLTSLEQIKGNEVAKETLIRAFESGRPHHAFLLSGPPGVGKATTARILGQSLLCKNGTIGFPCNTCPNCVRVSGNGHADWIQMGGDLGSIKIDMVRELGQQFNYRPFEGGARVTLIDGAEQMTQEAANALLKTLEEPPANSWFFLTSSNRSLLLDTIVSRCQHVRFVPLTPDDVMFVLDTLGVESEDAAVATSYSSGSPGKAVSFLTDPIFSARFEVLEGFLRLKPSVSILKFADWADFNLEADSSGKNRLDTQRHRVLSVLDLLRIWMRDVYLVKADGSSDRLVNKDLESSIASDALSLTWNQ